jgi:hypothetical protein
MLSKWCTVIPWMLLGKEKIFPFRDADVRLRNGPWHPDASAGPSTPEEDEYIAVDISFTIPIMDFTECFARMCSVRLPVRAWKDISHLDSVQLLRSVRATTNIGSVTSEGDLAMFSNLVRSRYGVDGSGILIGVLSTSYNCRGGASQDMATGDLPSGASRIRILVNLSKAECINTGNLMRASRRAMAVAPEALTTRSILAIKLFISSAPTMLDLPSLSCAPACKATAI